MTQKRNTTKILGCHIIQKTKWDCLVFYQDSAWFCIYQIDLNNKGKHNWFIMMLWSLFNLLKGWLKFAVSSLVVQWLRLHAPISGGPGLIPGWGIRSQFSSVQLLSCVLLFVTPWTTACQASLSITNSQSLLKLMSIESVMPSTISSPVVPFSSHLQSFPASGSFQTSQFFASHGLINTGVSASASVLPVNTQDLTSHSRMSGSRRVITLSGPWRSFFV